MLSRASSWHPLHSCIRPFVVPLESPLGSLAASSRGWASSSGVCHPLLCSFPTRLMSSLAPAARFLPGFAAPHLGYFPLCFPWSVCSASLVLVSLPVLSTFFWGAAFLVPPSGCISLVCFAAFVLLFLCYFWYAFFLCGSVGLLRLCCASWAPRVVTWLAPPFADVFTAVPFAYSFQLRTHRFIFIAPLPPHSSQLLSWACPLWIPAQFLLLSSAGLVFVVLAFLLGCLAFYLGGWLPTLLILCSCSAGLLQLISSAHLAYGFVILLSLLPHLARLPMPVFVLPPAGVVFAAHGFTFVLDWFLTFHFIYLIS